MQGFSQLLSGIADFLRKKVVEPVASLPQQIAAIPQAIRNTQYLPNSNTPRIGSLPYNFTKLGTQLFTPAANVQRFIENPQPIKIPQIFNPSANASLPVKVGSFIGNIPGGFVNSIVSPIASAAVKDVPRVLAGAVSSTTKIGNYQPPTYSQLSSPISKLALQAVPRIAYRIMGPEAANYAIKELGIPNNPQNLLADIAGTAEPIVSTFGMGKGISLGKQAIGENLAKSFPKALKQGFKTGAPISALFGAIQGLQEGRNETLPKQLLTAGIKTAEGYTIGGLFGAAIGGSTYATGKLVTAVGDAVRSVMPNATKEQISKVSRNFIRDEIGRFAKGSSKDSPIKQIKWAGEVTTKKEAQTNWDKNPPKINDSIREYLGLPANYQAGFIRIGNSKALKEKQVAFKIKAKDANITQDMTQPMTPSEVGKNIAIDKTMEELGLAKGSFGTEVKPRKFLETVQKGGTSEELKQAVGEISPQSYDVYPNKQALDVANKAISESPDLAKQRLFSAEPPSADKSAIAIQLARKFEKEKNLDEAVSVIESYDKQLRESGRFIQAASLWNKLSPDGILRAANRAAESAGQKLDETVKKVIVDRMGTIQGMPEGPAKEQETIKLLSFIADKIPPTWGEKFDAYRYQNMLSGPKTQERNIYSNLFNTLITRPLDIAFHAGYDLVSHPFNPMARDASLLDVPKYYKDVITSLPDAITAASQVFKLGASSDKWDLSTVKGDSAIESMRKANIPLKYTVVGRMMEAEDRFFSTLIAAGEKARLMAHGTEEGAAQTAAKTLAEQYMYREKLGASAKNAPLFVRALDSMGQFALSGRHLPIIGKPYSWFVPFVTTPINVAKMMIEHSPVGFIPGNLKQPFNTEQLAKATAGSLVTGVGAILAAQGKTTWDAPTDPKAKEYFYASGRKPFSVLINDKWMPMWYLGPFALALAIPAAAKQYNDDSRTALSDDQISKLINVAGSLSKFVISQTPLQGVSGFFRMLEGDTDVSLANLAGFTASQVIPLQGLVRYVNTILDPVYRKAHGVGQSMIKDLPVLSTQLDPYTNPTGEPSTREPINYLLPYDTGTKNTMYEGMYQGRNDYLQKMALINKYQKEYKTYLDEYKKLMKVNPTQAQSYLQQHQTEIQNAIYLDKVSSIIQKTGSNEEKVNQQTLRAINQSDNTALTGSVGPAGVSAGVSAPAGPSTKAIIRGRKVSMSRIRIRATAPKARKLTIKKMIKPAKQSRLAFKIRAGGLQKQPKSSKMYLVA